MFSFVENEFFNQQNMEFGISPSAKIQGQSYQPGFSIHNTSKLLGITQQITPLICEQVVMALSGAVRLTEEMTREMTGVMTSQSKASRLSRFRAKS